METSAKICMHMPHMCGTKRCGHTLRETSASKLNMAVNAWHLVIQEAPAGGSQVGKPGLQSKTLSKKKEEGAMF